MGKFYPKIQNYLFQVTNCTWTNSNMQNLKVMFTFFSVLDRKHTFWANLT